jgi:hypothetical protein
MAGMEFYYFKYTGLLRGTQQNFGTFVLVTFG